MTPKIATCCYCGNRAALVLKGTVRHELACASCGAPLHELKMFRQDVSPDRYPVRQNRPRGKSHAGSRPQRKARLKKQKSLSQRFLEEVFDAAEDLFDIFD